MVMQNVPDPINASVTMAKVGQDAGNVAQGIGNEIAALPVIVIIFICVGIAVFFLWLKNK